MSKIIIFFYLLSSIAFGVMIGTGKKHPSNTLLIANYLVDYEANDVKNKNGDLIQNYDIDLSSILYLFKPVYYTDNFAFNFTIPYTKTSKGISNEKITGISDISAGIGYFIPNSYGDLVLLSSVLFPTGKYDKNHPTALQLSQNRYEIQEELHFFKPTLLGGSPFIIDSSLLYYYRFDNLETKKENGSFYGAEATLSKVFSGKLFAGPSINYKYYDKEGLVSTGEGSSKWQYGLNALYKLNKSDSICVEYLQETAAKNTLEGERSIVRYVYFFK